MPRRFSLAGRAAALAVLASIHHAAIASEAVFSAAGPDAETYGAAEGYPIPPPGEAPAPRTMVGWSSHYDRLTPVHAVRKAGPVSVLRRDAPEIAPVYELHGQRFTIRDYLEHVPATGLLIARGDEILFEHYQYSRTDRHLLLSNSMAKTITGLLVGIALSEGAIRSLDDAAAAYVPELAGTEYGATPLRALLHMASGVAFSEAYQPGDDIWRLHGALVWKRQAGAAAALREFNRREAPPDTRWHYASAETEVLGLVVSRAVGTTLAEYAGTRIWQKLGAEADAAWTHDATGQEVAYCCFMATLRDWARLGLMLAHDGRWNGEQIVPKEWLIEATTVPVGADYLRNVVGGSWSYGYQVWLLPGGHRAFALMGVYGQHLFVDPDAKLVMVQTAVETKAQDIPRTIESFALWRSLGTSLSAPAAAPP